MTRSIVGRRVDENYEWYVYDQQAAQIGTPAHDERWLRADSFSNEPSRLGLNGMRYEPPKLYEFWMRVAA